MALAIWGEAANQPQEGRVAVGVVIRNRMRLHYQSDGTMIGTVEHPMAFSEFTDDWVNGEYKRVAFTADEIAARAENMRIRAIAQPVWADCQQAVFDSAPDSGFVGAPEFQKLTPDTVLYLNPSIVNPLPAWAVPEKQVAVIYSHTFYVA